MFTVRRHPVLTSLAALAVVATLAACGDDDFVDPTATPGEPALAAAPAAARPELAAARAATARYHDVRVAVADGYQLVSECVASPAGAMGVHYMNQTLLLDRTLDVARPEALLYEPQPNGTMTLVGVEYLIPKAMWDPANPGKRPTLFAGTAFEDGPMETHALHAWAWRPNPAGAFAAMNPQVRCPAAGGGAAHH